MPSEALGVFENEPTSKVDNQNKEVASSSKLNVKPESTSAEGDFDADLSEQRSYLFFSVGSNQYATKLMSIQEIIEVPAVKEVPRSVDYLAGVFNLRGEVSGLVDLNARLGYGPTKVTPQTAVLVFRTQHGSIGAMVDQIFSVSVVPESEIKVNSTIQTRIKETYLGGFLHSSDQITIIVDMQKLLDEDEFNQVNHIVQRAG
jgi:purine-binding chemotaxis protein CheW